MARMSGRLDGTPKDPSAAMRPPADLVRVTTGSPSLVGSLSPFALARHLWRQRRLIGQLTRREVEGRYRGSFLGIFWSFVSPLVLLAIYTFVGGVVLRIRWPASSGEIMA